MPRSVEIMNAGDLSGQGDVIMPRLRVLLKPTIEKTYHPVWSYVQYFVQKLCKVN